MCGGIVIAYSSTKIDTAWDKTKQTIAHILYSLGRITTYIFFGALFGYIGSVISFSNMANGILLIIAGLFMVGVGLSLSGKIIFLKTIEHSIQNSSWYHNNFRELLQSEFLGSFYILGLLNGLLPCGFVYFALAGAITMGNSLSGAAFMMMFGLGTTPIMLGTALAGRFISGNLRVKINKLIPVFAIILAVLFILRGLSLDIAHISPKLTNDSLLNPKLCEPIGF